MSRKIDISHKSVIFITFFLLALWIIFLIRDLLILIFVGLILMSALAPLVKFFERLKLPKALGILITYIIIITLVGGFIASLVPPLLEQSTKLITVLPPLLASQFNIVDLDKTVFQQELTNFSKNLFSFTLTVFDTLVAGIFLLVMTFYFLLEREGLESRIAKLFDSREEKIKRLIIRIEEKLGAWLRGQLVLSGIISALSYIGLTFFNIPYALPLALLAGVLEVVPVIGPIISAIPPVLIAFTIQPILALGVGVMYLFIQQMESHLIVPQIMKRAVGLNPLLVILAIAVGSRLLGISGALLAVPIAVVLQIIAADIIEERKD